MEPTWLDTSETDAIREFLIKHELIRASDTIARVIPAGDGNMNVTLRVEISAAEPNDSAQARSLIVKQSRPFVAKYPQIEAPLERIHFEMAFYDFVRQFPEVANRMPARLAAQHEQYALVLEDLGTSADASSWYNAPPDNLLTQLESLFAWLTELHTVSRGCAAVDDFRNARLRALNHAHIFEIPFQDPPAIPLDEVCPGLEAASLGIRTNADLRERCVQLGQRYLADGDCLLHGDFYPGSWLVGAEEPVVIDPEFCFVGPAEFDIGVMLAHVRLIGRDDATDGFLNAVSRHATNVDTGLVEQFASVEILRRLLGVAQLPLNRSLDERMKLVEEARRGLS